MELLLEAEIQRSFSFITVEKIEFAFFGGAEFSTETLHVISE